MWKPRVESDMPIVGFDLPRDHTININPLEDAAPMPEITLPELIIPDSIPQMPNMLEKEEEGGKPQ
ncbi:MAG: hypothetical protein ACLFOZ_19950 [Cyclobacteriaceae bacterium]